MNHTEAFGNLALFSYLFEILDQVTCFPILTLHFVDLINFVGVFVLLHRIYQGYLSHRKVVLFIMIFIAVFFLSRRALVHFRFVYPIVVISFRDISWSSVKEDQLLDVFNEIGDALVLISKLRQFLLEMSHGIFIFLSLIFTVPELLLALQASGCDISEMFYMATLASVL